MQALRSLEDQIHAGYVRGVHKALDQIAAAEPHCAPFVQRMRTLARQFHLDAMAKLIDEALAQSQDQAEQAKPSDGPAQTVHMAVPTL